MVFSDAFEYLRRFFPLFYQVGTDGRVRSFDFAVDGLADIVKQADLFGDSDIGPDLRGDYTGQIGYLDAMFQGILTVAGTIFKPSEQLDQFGMKLNAKL